MSLHRFFLKEQRLSDETDALFALRLSDDDLRHAKVLRLFPGEHIAVIDAGSDYFECEISSFDDEMVVGISSHREGRAEPFHVTLFQALAKGDKMETVIRHATEVGASAFAPFSAARSVAKLDGAKADKKVERWSAIAKSAAMQSGRELIPEVMPVTDLKGAIDRLSRFDAVVILWEEAGATCSLSSALDSAKRLEHPDVAIVVGPEGGLSDEEIEALLASNPYAGLVTLGPNILRTETAGIVGCALVSYELGGMGASSGNQQGVA